MVLPSERLSLVTGAGGFLGRYLTAALLEQGERVRALDTHVDALGGLAASPRLELVTADVCDPEVQARALRGVQTVFHLAAAHLGVSAGEEEFRRVNVDGSRTLAIASSAAGVRRFVHCSSVGVYGSIPSPPADEDSPCRPELVYERTKLEGEMEVRAASEQGLDVVILRPVWIYGPGCGRTEKLLSSIRKGRFLVAGSGEGLRHCISIWDAVDAFLLARDADVESGTVLIVGDRRPVTVRELVDTIAQVVDARPPRAIPFALFAVIAAGAEAAFRPLGKEPPVSRRTLRFFTGNTAFDVTRARNELGFSARDDLATGLRRTDRWLREHRAEEWLSLERSA